MHVFACNSAESEPIWMKTRSLWVHCWGWPRQISGAIRAVATVWEACKILFFFCHVNNARFQRFTVGQISRNLNYEYRILKNFIARDRFKKRKNFSQNFNVLRVQAAITTQWLQITRNSLPNTLSTGCPVSTFIVRINSKSFPQLYTPYKKSTYRIFGNVRYCVDQYYNSKDSVFSIKYNS